MANQLIAQKVGETTETATARLQPWLDKIKVASPGLAGARALATARIFEEEFGTDVGALEGLTQGELAQAFPLGSYVYVGETNTKITLDMVSAAKKLAPAPGGAAFAGQQGQPGGHQAESEHHDALDVQQAAQRAEPEQVADLEQHA